MTYYFRSALVLFLLGAAQAQAATLDPPSSSGGANAFWDTPGLPDPARPTEGANTSQRSANSFASNTVDLSKAPSVSAYASANLPGGPTGGAGTYRAAAISGAGLTYMFEVIGPLATVPVRIVANLSVKIVAPLADLYSTSANASLQIVSDRGARIFNSGIETSNNGGSETGGLGLFRPKTASYDQYLSLLGGTRYIVTMSAVALADKGSAPVYPGSGGAVAEAFVDPYFEIDPAFVARGYSLAFSDGIRNSLTDPGDPDTPPVSSVPLPASALLLLGALGCLARFGRRAAARS